MLSMSGFWNELKRRKVLRVAFFYGGGGWVVVEGASVIFPVIGVPEQALTFTVDDPTTYTQLWGGVIPYKRFHDKLFEYACHEGNYSLASVLSGARYEERMEAEESSDARR